MTAMEYSGCLSRVPKFTFAGTLEEQQKQLVENPLMLRFAESRRKFLSDRYRPAYHFVNPENGLNDPNGLCFWQGRWHLFYQAYPPEENRVHWGHAVSDDLLHWQDLPYAIYPDVEEQCYSGSIYVEPDRVIAMYHGTKAGNMVAVSSDPLLLNWEKVTNAPVIPIKNEDGSDRPYPVFDPCIWEKDNMYYSLSAGTSLSGPDGKCIRADVLFRSRDLIEWEYMHEFVENDMYSFVGDDGACPYFWPIGDKHILLHFSHMSGGRYLVGDYDTERDKLVVTDGGKFNFGSVYPSAVHAPSACPDGKGGVNVIFNMNPGARTEGWDQIMSLPRRLNYVSSDPYNPLRVEPAVDTAALRHEHRRIDDLEMPSNRRIILDEIRGNCYELQATFLPGIDDMLEFELLRSDDGEECTRVQFFPGRGFPHREYLTSSERHSFFNSVVAIDASASSGRKDAAMRPPEMAQVFIDKDEPLEFRIFVDRSIVEVFVNGKQCLGVRVYPDKKDSQGISLLSRGGDATLASLDFWKMRSIYNLA